MIYKVRNWIRDYKHARERCEWCGWYLHPQLMFKNINRPSRLTYWKESNGQWVCAKCHYLNEQLCKQP